MPGGMGVAGSIANEPEPTASNDQLAVSDASSNWTIPSPVLLTYQAEDGREYDGMPVFKRDGISAFNVLSGRKRPDTIIITHFDEDTGWNETRDSKQDWRMASLSAMYGIIRPLPMVVAHEREGAGWDRAPETDYSLAYSYGKQKEAASKWAAACNSASLTNGSVGMHHISSLSWGYAGASQISEYLANAKVPVGYPNAADSITEAHEIYNGAATFIYTYNHVTNTYTAKLVAVNVPEPSCTALILAGILAACYLRCR